MSLTSYRPQIVAIRTNTEQNGVWPRKRKKMSTERRKLPRLLPRAVLAQFEAKLGAYYVLSLLARSEPRGLSGAVSRAVELQRRVDGHPLDDVIVQAVNADGSPATLEIQAKRTLTFTASDEEFRDIVGQMWEAAKKPEFRTQRYELAVAIARTTTRVEFSCQEVLHWARNLPDAATFAARIKRIGFASDGMRDFVEVFRANLAYVGGPTDDEIVWQLLRRFQILPFDFESAGSDYEHRARERARLVLAQSDAHRASTLWPILIDYVGASGRSSGALTHDSVVTALKQEHGFQFEARADLLTVEARLADEAERVLGEIHDEVGGVRLARFDLIDDAYKLLDDHRVLHIVGAGGCGKSAILKHIARGLQQEARVMVLRNGRVPPGGWLSMANRIGCSVSLDELFNELGCGGGATLFVDNIDQIEDAGEWATVSDLMTAVVKNPGWRAVVTGSAGNDDWKTKLAAATKSVSIATLEVSPLSDDEVAVLSAENKTLGLIMRGDHPAKDIARNLFYLSRLVELSGSDAQAAAGIASELDLAKLWWRYGGGRSEDAGRLARLRVLRIVGAQVITNPGRTAFNVDELDSTTVEDLLRFDSLQEVIRGATVSFRHDVLRDWTIGFMLHQNNDLLASLAMDHPISAGLSRGLEITARCALDADTDGKAWLSLLNLTERERCHGSWKRPILLALTRSEHALLHMNELKSALLENNGRRLGELLRLMIAVESTPLAKALSRIQPSIAIPAGVDDLIVPKGLGWMWLVMWLVVEAESLPAELIPDVARVFQAWLIWTQNQNADALNSKIVGLLFDWLAKIEERMTPRTFRRIEDAPPPLNIPHMRDVRDRIQLSVFSFARHNPAAAASYLSSLTRQKPGYHDQRTILKASGTLAMAAPKELADFVLETIIEKEDRDPWSSQRNRYGPFGAHDHLYSRASPSQGPFLDLLEHAPAEGLRLVRAVVEHATEWRRDLYREERASFPRLTIQFPEGSKSFDGDFSVYHWSRSIAPSTVTASALMALEAWGHKQIESGRPFSDVLHDVLGPDGSSAAFLLVAVDLVLSHWPLSRDVALPMVGSPELLMFDDIRHPKDLMGVDRLSVLDQEADNGRVKKADLEARPSRRLRVADTFGRYVFGGNSEQLTTLRALLDQAHNEIKQGSVTDKEDAVSGLRATAARALRMTFPEHWPIVKIAAEDGSEHEVHQFQAEASERELVAERQARSNESLRQMNIRLQLQHALLKHEKAASETLREGVEWAKRQELDTISILEEDDNDADFNKQWDQRAVVMAAALAARDYEGDDRGEIVEWARPILTAAARQRSERYGGSDQIEYNAPAIATVGLSGLYVKTQEIWVRDELLRLASHEHQAVVRALGQSFMEFDRVDDRLVRAMVRVAMVSCIYFRRSEEDEANRLAQKAKIDASMEAERRWLAGELAEPDWPEIPPWHLRPRRSVRLPGIAVDDDNEELEETASAEVFVDERQLGELVGHLIGLTISGTPWLVPLTKHLMGWTLKANGPTRDERWQSNNRPSSWNRDFFDFVGVLSVTLPHADVVEIMQPIADLHDDAFHDCAAAFLRGFDRATLATDTKFPDNPAGVRRMIANRIKEGWNYRRFEDEKTFMSETHAGDVLTAMYYQPPAFMNNGNMSLPAKWTGLDATIETLTELAVGAPTSGYIAELFLNVIKTSPRGALLPFVIAAAAAWGMAYGTDVNFWSEREVGGRLCGWVERTLDEDQTCISKIIEVRDALFKCLDVLVRSGVAQASDVENRIVQLLLPHQNSLDFSPMDTAH
jgi:hypothetical protein